MYGLISVHEPVLWPGFSVLRGFIRSSKPYVELVLNNKCSSIGLLDSGASINLIGYKLFSKLGKCKRVAVMIKNYRSGDYNYLVDQTVYLMQMMPFEKGTYLILKPFSPKFVSGYRITARQVDSRFRVRRSSDLSVNG